MSKWTYIVYKKSGIQKDILAIQCQMLNLCNDTKPSNHLSSQWKRSFDLYLKCKSCHTYNPTKHSFNGPHIKLFLSDTMKKPLNQLPKKFFFFFSYRQKKNNLALYLYKPEYLDHLSIKNLKIFGQVFP